MPKVFVQGDRNPVMGIARCAAKAAELLNLRGWEANVGAFGGLVRIFEDSGTRCHVHLMSPRDREVQFSDRIASITDARRLIRFLPEDTWEGDETDRMLTWSIRLGIWMARSDAFLFFAGHEGTLAHLIPVLAHNQRAEAGKERRIALIGWPKTQIEALRTLGLIETTWVHSFGDYLGDVERAVDFLTKEE